MTPKIDTDAIVCLALKKEFEELTKNIEELKNRFNDAMRATLNFDGSLRRRYYEPLNNREKALNNQYNSAVDHLNETLSKKGFDIKFRTFGRFTSSETYGLDNLEIQSKKAVKILESLIIPVSPDLIEKLEPIRKQINSEIEDPTYKDNLINAVEEFEVGHSLASCLITSRIIDHLIAKIPLKDKEDKETPYIDNKIKYLVDKGIIDKKRVDIKTSIIKANKKARDFLSHNLDIDTSPSHAVSLLGDTVNLIKILTKI